MSNSLYVTATEARSGKSVISLGLMEMLLRRIERVGFFRPMINAGGGRNGTDNSISLISSCFELGIPYEQMYGYTAEEASDLFSAGKEDEIVEGIIRKYHELEKRCDFILCEGTDFASSTAAFELDINAEISKNLGSPVLLVAKANQKSVDQTTRSIELALDSLNDKGCYTIATIANRADPKDGNKIIKGLREKDLLRNQLIYVIPEEESLGRPTVRLSCSFP